jgi:hypothetical protein
MALGSRLLVLQDCILTLDVKCVTGLIKLYVTGQHVWVSPNSRLCQILCVVVLPILRFVKIIYNEITLSLILCPIIAYFQCVNGVGVEQMCPSGFYFDFPAQMCNPANTVVCSNPPCSGRPDNFFEDNVLGGCGDYFICFNGVGIPNTCPNGLYFDFERQMCDFPESVNCVSQRKDKN